MLPNKSLTQTDLAAWDKPSGIKKAPPKRGELNCVGVNRKNAPRAGVPLSDPDGFGHFRRGQVGLSHDLIPKFLWLQTQVLASLPRSSLDLDPRHGHLGGSNHAVLCELQLFHDLVSTKCDKILALL